MDIRDVKDVKDVKDVNDVKDGKDVNNFKGVLNDKVADADEVCFLFNAALA